MAERNNKKHYNNAFKISNMGGESFPKTIQMLTMIMNEQQTMPYYLSDELASKPYNRKLPTK